MTLSFRKKISQIFIYLLLLASILSCSDDEEAGSTPGNTVDPMSDTRSSFDADALAILKQEISEQQDQINTRQEYTHSLNKVEFKDYYQWLAVTSTQTLAWKQHQTALTQQYFDGSPTLSLTDSNQYEKTLAQRFFDRIVYLERHANSRHFRVVQQHVSGDERKVLATLNNSPLQQVTKTAIDPHGRFFALEEQLSSQHYQWHIIDLASGELLDIAFPVNRKPSRFYWNESGQFYYVDGMTIRQGSALASRNYPLSQSSLLVFSLADYLDANGSWSPAKSDQLNELESQPELLSKLSSTFSIDLLRFEHLNLVSVTDRNSGSQRLLAQTASIEKKTANKTATTDFIQLIKPTKAYFEPVAYFDNQLFLLTNLSAARNRVISIDLDKPERRHWDEELAQSNALLKSAHFAKEQWLLHYVDNTNSQLKIASKNFRKIHSIEVPKKSTITISQHTSTSNPNLLLSIQTPYSLGRFYALEQQLLTPLAHVEQSLANTTQSTEMTSEVAFFRSNDGARIPISLLYYKDSEKSIKTANNPTLIFTHNGFGESVSYPYNPLIREWLNKGGLVAFIHARGDSTFGSGWHKAAVGRNRHRTVEDLNSGIQWLIDKNYTQAHKIGAVGHHFSSSLWSEAIIEKPSLYGAALLSTGQYDYMLPFQEQDETWTTEFNVQQSELSTQWLLTQSPYHRLTENNYPATLLIADSDDIEAQKMLAKWQQSQQNTQPILLLNNKQGSLNRQLIFLSNELELH